MKLKIFNYIQYFYKKKKKLIFEIKNYSDFLQNGLYSIQPSYAYHKKYKPFFTDELINIFLKCFYFTSVKVFSKNKVFEGKLIFLNAQGSIKIFNDVSVLTFLENKNIDKMINNYKQVDDFFDYPRIITIHNNYYIEEFILDKKKKNLEELHSIYHVLLNFYSKQKIEYKKLSVDDFVWEKLTVKNKLFIESIYTTHSYPFVLSHNDIHFGNILIGDKMYIIDWEYFGENLIYYDFLNILFVEALNGDRSFLEFFFSGELDSYFEKLFSIFNLKYNKNNRKKYFDIYLLNKIILRDIQESKVHLNKVLINYQKVRKNYC